MLKIEIEDQKRKLENLETENKKLEEENKILNDQNFEIERKFEELKISSANSVFVDNINVNREQLVNRITRLEKKNSEQRKNIRNLKVKKKIQFQF